MKQSVKELKNTANLIRQDIIKMLARAGSGHPGGSLGLADILTVLYFSVLNHIPSQPNNPRRDRLILSNGHVCPALYATLARARYFPLVKLKTLRQINSQLQGHPHNLSLPGVETSSGPLGQGISQAVGMALAGQMDKGDYSIFCLTSDGEHDEGQLWEAVMTAAKYQLGNLINIVDRNNIQIDGYTKDIMPLKPLKQKYSAFGWQVMEMNGHNLKQIISVLNRARRVKNKPVVIIAHTVLGKGVDFMENKFIWHGQAPNQKETTKALQQLSHQP
ncbi:MAG: transketolase [Candidatus Komeilibacteria bacterium CG11_big_fil_rev_8_21_14_0_20_36_20]|uniref:Transketolase n=1 Tax=Candidatus Komeilibacteria bacterium CG11_big_fil_rev_8_21_14_0_20_36_20 TaxID=1974477 RepID=A0A2H0NEL7_9BACT|nr:MAG: transketolase [Candidatus Komeilibacteria bacterium CG11_big_fil_rev_8_21_14_0_20_36_20]PIR81635.1 MAG: transketolase [Candidatus Komeilibacteria bacterium CG10_big_fil_rev_8_21_14_0_10_36_65]PJC55790.1 MAG: transketolase [Candidatus Komeilibacteria bacterium CG_4_9_14_0_2_um_filter_36_13]